MKKAVKRIVLALGGLAAFLLLVGVAASVLMDSVRFREKVERALSEASGMDARIEGKMGVALLPAPKAYVKDISFQKMGEKVFSASEVNIFPKISPLFSRRFEAKGIGLVRPRLNLVRDAQGRLNVEPPRGKTSQGGAIPVESISVEGGELSYRDEKAKRVVSARGVDLEIKGLCRGISKGANGPAPVSFRAVLEAEELGIGSLRAEGLRCDIRFENGRLTAGPFSATVFGGKAKGRVLYSEAAGKAEAEMDFRLSGLDLGRMFEELRGRKVFSGRVDVSARMKAKAKTPKQLARGASGEVSIRGSGLQMNLVDMDALIEQFERSRRLSLLDVGSFFVAGPFGPLLTKGYDYAGLYRRAGEGVTHISRLVSEWRVEDGVARARDVAFSTRQNRVAFKGRLNFVTGRYEDAYVAVLDSEGCAKIRQGITGPLRSPQAGGIAAESALGPVRQLFEKARKFLAPGKCEVFYTGSIRHPDKKKPAREG